MVAEFNSNKCTDRKSDCPTCAGRATNRNLHGHTATPIGFYRRDEEIRSRFGGRAGSVQDCAAPRWVVRPHGGPVRLPGPIRSFLRVVHTQRGGQQSRKRVSIGPEAPGIHRCRRHLHHINAEGRIPHPLFFDLIPVGSNRELLRDPSRPLYFRRRDMHCVPDPAHERLVRSGPTGCRAARDREIWTPRI